MASTFTHLSYSSVTNYLISEWMQKTICSWRTQTCIQVQDITLTSREGSCSFDLYPPITNCVSRQGQPQGHAVFSGFSPIRDHCPISTWRGCLPSCINPHCCGLNVTASYADLTKSSHKISLSSAQFILQMRNWLWRLSDLSDSIN